MLPPGNESDLPGSDRSNAIDAGAGPEAVIVPVVFGVIFVVGLVGNSLVMVVVGRVRYSGAGVGRRRRAGSPTNIFILNLSVADLSFILVCVPLHATVYSLPDWVFGSFLCTFGHFFTSVSMLVSVFTLVALSVDRYVAVVRSGASPAIRSRKNALAGLVAIWLLAVACSSPVARHQVLVSHPSAPNSTFCWEQWSGASRRAYRLTILLAGYLVPLLLISCCYTQVLFHLHKKLKKSCKRSERSKKKTSQTVLLVVAAFAICWIPHHIIALWVEFGSFPLNDASFAFRIIAHCLSYGNSCVNPVLYAFLSKNFREACRQVFSSSCLFQPPREGPVKFLRTETASTTHSTTNI